MNTTDTPKRDYIAEQEAREAWLTKRIERPADKALAQQSEIHIDIEGLGRFRIFKSADKSQGWLTYLHRQTYGRDAELGFKFEFKGEREFGFRETRRQAITWIAIHWDRTIEDLMAAEAQS